MSGIEPRMLAARYRLTRVIGRGGMGTVWQAYDEVLCRDVAVKELLLPTGIDDAEQDGLQERAMREARAAAGLDHPGVIGIYDILIEEDRPWIVMQLVNGRSLDELVRADGALPVTRVVEIGLKLLDALSVAHVAGVLHRDITPRNVLVADDGRVILTDFGIAAVAGMSTRLTRTGVLVGSPGYIPPERLRGNPPAAAADLWSLGATLYFAVEGRPAYEAEEVAAVIGAVLTRDPAPISHGGGLQSVLEQLLARDPDQRPTLEEARDRLTAMQSATSVETAAFTVDRKLSTPRKTPAPRKVPVARKASKPRMRWTGKVWLDRRMIVLGAVLLVVIGLSGWLAYPLLKPVGQLECSDFSEQIKRLLPDNRPGVPVGKDDLDCRWGNEKWRLDIGFERFTSTGGRSAGTVADEAFEERRSTQLGTAYSAVSVGEEAFEKRYPRCSCRATTTSGSMCRVRLHRAVQGALREGRHRRRCHRRPDPLTVPRSCLRAAMSLMVGPCLYLRLGSKRGAKGDGET